VITTSTQWDSLCQRPGQEVTIVVRMYYGAESAYKSFANRELTIGTEKFLGVIQGVPTVIQQLDMKEHIHSIQSLTLGINNLEYWPGKRWSDLVEDTSLGSGADIGFYNRKIDIRLYLDGITTFANCFPLLSNGIVRNIKHSRKQTTIEIEDRTGMMYQDIGTYMADTDAADTDQGLPVDSQGKIKPITYGDRRYYQGDDSKALDTTSTLNNMTPCVYLGQDSTGRHRWFVTGHEVNEISLAGEQQQIWGWVTELGRFVRMVTAVSIEQNNASGCIFSVLNDSYFIDHWYGKGTVTSATQGAGSSVANESRIIDKQFDIYSGLIVGPDEGIGDYAKVTIPFPAYDGQGISDDNIFVVRLFLYGKLFYYGGAGDGDFEITINDAIPVPDQYPTGLHEVLHRECDVATLGVGPEGSTP